MTGAIEIAGWGAVSPAGWSAAALAEAVMQGMDLPVTEERRVEDAPVSRFRSVPALSAPPPWLRHARLRRSSPISRYAMSAALQTLGQESVAAPTIEDRDALGVIFVTMNGSVNFSRRFYAEVLDDPSLASPIVFPETVFNAPSSHISAVLGTPGMNYTLVGDTAQFLRGLDVAAQWLEEGQVKECLVVGAEEIDWLSSEALKAFPGGQIASEGAAALLLRRTHGEVTPGALVLEQITEAALIGNHTRRAEAAQKMRAELPGSAGDADAVLCDSLRGGDAGLDREEEAVWQDWAGARYSVLKVLGEGFGVSAGWQCVLGCELLTRGQAARAVIGAVGTNEQAIGAVIARSLN